MMVFLPKEAEIVEAMKEGPDAVADLVMQGHDCAGYQSAEARFELRERFRVVFEWMMDEN